MLTEQQKIAYDAVINSDKRIITILGNAGVGKSFIISQIAKDYDKSFLITATTNKAKELLEQQTGRKCFTTHSIAGYVMAKNGIRLDLTKVRDPISAHMIIVDEFSMLTQNILNTLLQAPYEKIVLVGDLLQLPAIGLKAKIPSDSVIVQLTENMRQQENQALKVWLDDIRENIKQQKYFDITAGSLPPDVYMYNDHKLFAQQYLNCNSSKRILAYSNQVVDSYNRNINEEKFKINDFVIIDKPLGNCKNGDILQIIDLTEEDDKYQMTLQQGLDIYYINVFKTKKAESDILVKCKTTAEYWTKVDTIYHPKHLFASTVHKAQGQTIDEVFIDLTYIKSQLFRKPTKYNHFNPPISLDEYLRLVYVAISRMRKKAHLFIGEKRDYKYFKQTKTKKRENNADN